MRKASGALLLAICAALLPSYSWADDARDGAVNPGNAAHLGATEAQEAEDSAPATGDTESAQEEDPGPEYINQALLPACECCAPCGTLEFFGPVAVINQHPPNLLFLSPVPETATVLPSSARELRLKLEWTNVIIRELDSGVIIDYDHETLRTTAEYCGGLAGGELSARLPFYYRGHGILDHSIAEWHRWFNLKNGLRDDFPDQMYRYTIVTRDGSVFNDEGDTAGIGDLALAWKYGLWNRGAGGDAAALRVGLKAPLGDPDKALGSGNWDWQVGALYQRQLSRRLRGYVNVDWVGVGEPDWENVAYQDMLVTLWALEYAWRPGTTIVAQYRTQRNPLRIGSYEGDKDAQELGLGFNHRLSDRVVWSGGFNEDINPETAPDFILTTQICWEF